LIVCVAGRSREIAVPGDEDAEKQVDTREQLDTTGLRQYLVGM